MDLNHTDLAYRQAVSKLRSILSPSVIEHQTPTSKPVIKRIHPSNHKIINEYSLLSNIDSSLIKEEEIYNLPKDLLELIQKQEHYIFQLENEGISSRNELKGILLEVEEIIAENEALLEEKNKQNNEIKQIDPITSKHILDLENQLFNTKKYLKIAQQEIISLKNSKSSQHFLHLPKTELHYEKERDELIKHVAKLNEELENYKKGEIEAKNKVKSSLELIENMERQKIKFENEAKYSKEQIDELKKQLKQLIEDYGKKLITERNECESKIRMEYDDKLKNLSIEVEDNRRLKIELEREKDIIRELKRDINQKQRYFESNRLEDTTKISELESRLHQIGLQKVKAETDLSNLRIEMEKLEREGRKDTVKSEMEINTLKRKLDQTENDLRKCSEILSLFKLKATEFERKIKCDEALYSNWIELENKLREDMKYLHLKYDTDRSHWNEVVERQSDLVTKLKAECSILTEKLEETVSALKDEKVKEYNNSTKFKQLEKAHEKKIGELQLQIQYYNGAHQQLTQRLHLLEQDEQSHAQKVASLISKQRTIAEENNRLREEIASLKMKCT